MALVGVTEIPKDEYRKLTELKGRVDAFSGYVNKTNFSVDREICAAMLGFELKKVGEDAGADRE